MDFTPNPDHEAIREGVRRLCRDFPDTYWADKDEQHEFPWEYYKAMAEAGWVGICIPEEYGGGGQGITEATIVLEEVARSGAAMNGCSAIHLSILRPGTRRPHPAHAVHARPGRAHRRADRQGQVRRLGPGQRLTAGGLPGHRGLPLHRLHVLGAGRDGEAVPLVGDVRGRRTGRPLDGVRPGQSHGALRRPPCRQAPRLRPLLSRHRAARSARVAAIEVTPGGQWPTRPSP